MPFRLRKRTIAEAMIDVLIAPFVFFAVLFVSSLPLLLLTIFLCLLSMWLAGEPLGNPLPTPEQWFVVLALWCVVALAAIPLAIRDYFSEHGYELVWEPSDECHEFARRTADQLLNEEFAAVYDQFSEELQSKMTLEQFEQHVQAIWGESGRWTSYGAAQEVRDGALYPNANALIRIEFRHFAQKTSILELHVNHSEETKVLHFAYDYAHEVEE